MSAWKTMESVPEGELVLCYCPKAHRGTPSCEVLMAFRHDGTLSFWTNGGPNAGDDMIFDEDEEPTHWMPLPPPPLPGESNARIIATPKGSNTEGQA